jgi:lactoylglutathione lyase
MLRVSDMQRSIDFYTDVIGMRVLRILDQPQEKYTLTFLGFGDEADTCVLELTYNYGITEYNMGNAYGHIAISVDNCFTACADIKSKSGNIILEPQPLPGSNETIAFVVDPDGYQIELIHRK